jgi:2-polyprenyl-3-methyl-5-hydroxy-6-metoxy-1,4-benzoquinol methylase
MRDEEITRKIAGFPRWHYQFDLKGNITPIWDEKWVNRHRQRKWYFFDPLVQLFGGSLRGKRVLDLGCNAGFWSLCAVRAGCDYVLGIDGRQMHVDQSNFVFEVEEIEKDRYDFMASNIFEVDFRELGGFDLVLCLGLLYHVSKPVELFEKISEINDDVLLVDTALSTLSGPSFQLHRESLEEPRAAVDYELVMRPSWEAVRDLAQQFGYGVAALEPGFDDYTGAEDYRKGIRRAFLCAKKTDVSRLPAKIEPARPDHRRNRPGQGRVGVMEGVGGERREALRHLNRGRRLARVATETLKNEEKNDSGGNAADAAVASDIEEAIQELEKARALL